MKNAAWIDLGTLHYAEAWKQQEKLLEKLIAEKQAGISGRHYLLLVEHPSIYTLGKNGNQANMLIVPSCAQQPELLRVNRGGDITYHGPGQLVVYPIFRLDALGIGIKEYVHRLEEVVIRTIAAYSVQGSRMEKATGVWLDVQTEAARKICAIGVRCSQSVTMHGFALNVNTDLNYFNYINPCGFSDKGVTSLAKETGKKPDMEDVKNLVLQYFEEIFGIRLGALN